MALRTPFARSPVALLANAGTWLNQALESMLEPLGYRVLSVATGRELLDRAPTARPDVILMDANLHDLDSITVCRTLRQQRAVSWHTPIFMIPSTPATKQQRLAALQARGRTSDAIGRLGRNEFGVLAPSTAPDGAVRMARRLTQALETASPRPAGLPPLLVRAGYEAVADLHATPLAPDRLLEHAGAALIQARTAGNGERIRAYQE